MKLNSLEFTLMNNPIRAALQRRIETPVLIGDGGALADKRVLEVGCGRGVGVEILLSLNAQYVTAFDFDSRMVAPAHKRLARHTDRAGVFVGDAALMPFPSNSLDGVIEYGILHHVPHWQQAIREVARVLKPGGIFYFDDIFRGFTSGWLARGLFDHPQATQFTDLQFYGCIAGAGLRPVRWVQLINWGVSGRAIKPLTQGK